MVFKDPFQPKQLYDSIRSYSQLLCVQLQQYELKFSKRTSIRTLYMQAELQLLTFSNVTVVLLMVMVL